MQVRVSDFNGAADLMSGALSAQWQTLSQVLEQMPLHLKSSDQAGLQGKAIFDPVGTNEHIKEQLLQNAGWASRVVIPKEYQFLGTDVDFISGALLVEVQFSNYPFLLNNLLRSELFFKAQTLFGGVALAAAVIITKARMFPASNSTLYYEQAFRQLSALAEKSVYDAPIRLVGLFEKYGDVAVTWTEYHKPRYSRTVVSRSNRTAAISAPKAPSGISPILIQ